ncbi:unnamed protein product [Blepharisma stoltei]|uniref:Uncharacterized protein n=1 Tax=Blepharisma stoltei TaxID=1481888 RepID=A0AAU9JXV7_9CILI|nr:unnamed protein product [Blepharisma stoltei]
MYQFATSDQMKLKLTILAQIKKRQIQRAYLIWYNEASKNSIIAKYNKLKAYALKLLRKRSPGRAPKIEIKSVKSPKTPEIEEKGAPAPMYTERAKTSSTDKQFLLKTFSFPKKPKEQATPSTKEHTPNRRTPVKRNTSAPPKSPKNLFDKIRNDLQQKALRSDTPTERKSIEIGERLFRNAEVINKKKEILRSNSKENYSFKPKILESTHKWLNKRDGKADQAKKEQVAIVSCSEVMTSRANRFGFLKTFDPECNMADQSNEELEVALGESSEKRTNTSSEIIWMAGG